MVLTLYFAWKLKNCLAEWYLSVEFLKSFNRASIAQHILEFAQNNDYWTQNKFKTGTNFMYVSQFDIWVCLVLHVLMSFLTHVSAQNFTQSFLIAQKNLLLESLLELCSSPKFLLSQLLFQNLIKIIFSLNYPLLLLTEPV